jgi:hypothetical protein
MADTINMQLKLDISDMRKKMRELPKESAKAAEKALNQWTAALKKSEKQARKVDRETKKAVEQAKKLSKESAALKGKAKAGFEALKQAATGAGGSIGAAGGQVEAFSRSILEAGSALGPMGAAAAVTALAVVGVAAGAVAAGSAIVSLVSNSAEWVKILEEAGAAGDLITDEELASIEDAAAAMDGISIAAQRVGVVLSTEFSQSVEVGAMAVIKLTDVVEKFMPELTALGGAFVAAGVATVPFGKAMLATTASTWALVGGLDGLHERLIDDEGVRRAIDGKAKLKKGNDELAAAASAAAKSIAADDKRIAKGKADAEKAHRAHLQALADEVRLLDQIGRAMEAGLKAEEARGKEAGANIREFAALSMELDGITEAARGVELDEVGKINALYDERMSRLGELAAAGVSAAEIAQSQFAVEMGYIAALSEAATAASKKKQEEFKADVAQAGAATAGLLGDLGGVASVASENAAEQAIHWAEQSAKAHAAGNHTKGKADAERAATARKASLKSFKASQAAALAEATISAGVAALTMIPAFSFMGPFAPVGAAAAAATALGLQVATINQQSPPSFAAGGVVGRAFGEGSTSDHVTIQADPREGIVSARGMDALGADGLESLNAGGGFGGSLNVTLVLDGQTLAAAVATPSVKRAIVAELRLNQGAGRGTSYGRG